MTATGQPHLLARAKRTLALGLALPTLAACAGMAEAPPPAQPPVPSAPAENFPLPPIAMMAPLLPAGEPADDAGLRAAYGRPDFVRHEAGSELWRYDAGHCAVFFFLYRSGSALMLRYVETMPEGMSMAADPACLASLSARARPTS